MALRVKIDKPTYDALSDALKAEYKANGDGYVLDADYEDVAGLKSALAKTKEERDKLRVDLKAEADKFKDIDPERAREALKALADIDEKKLVDKGEYDRLLKKRSDEFDVREAEFKKQLDSANVRLDTYELVNPIRDAALKSGVLSTSIDLVLDHVVGKRAKLGDKRLPVILDKDGDPSPLTPEQFFSGEFKETYPNLYAGSGAGGSGAQNNGGGGADGKKTVTREAFDAMDQPARMQAAKDGVQVV